MRLILASRSPARSTMLHDAGVQHEAIGANVDEDQAKAAMRDDGLDARALADALAELKAVKLSRRHPDALVLGCDQTLATAEGDTLDKPASRAEATAQLRRLRGGVHRLASAVVACEGGRPVWRHVDVARLQMRPFGNAFLETYLDAEWPAIGGCVGGYRLEGLGAQLFSRIDGSYFTVLGLPLLPLLDWLRVRGLLAT